MEKKVDKHASQIMMIKPSFPTPNHKNTVRLSLLDQLCPSLHIRIVFFYANPINRSLLTNSLSGILTQFYPYAGRFVDNCSIECTDDGVMYTESEIDSFLSDVLSKRDPNMLEQFFPVVVHLEGLETIPLLIQANFFKCGGFALGVMASHRIMDAGALSTFICSWAITACNKKVEAPDFSIPSSLYPPSDFLNTKPDRSLVQKSADICVTKRFVFYGSSISELKMKLDNIHHPTRVALVSALIWKCAMKASQTLTGSRSSSILLQAVNLRKRWEPSLPENTPGNNICPFSVQIVHNDNELSSLVQLFKDGLREFCDNYMKKLQESVEVRCRFIFKTMQEIGNMYKKDGLELYFVSSWCNFPIYDADFGCGKPVWISYPSSVKNAIWLMDTKEGDGIEARITLKAEHMAAFEQDEDLLHFANCPCPNISNS